MGMSSSQARLLTLTARMHDIEYKAQRIEAQKLQLANDSARAYEDYLIALDAKKIQYKAINSDGSLTFRDANCDILQNGCVAGYTGETATEVLFLQKQDGTLLVTPTVANKFGLNNTASAGDMDTYIRNVTGKNKTPQYGMKPEEDKSQILSVTTIPNKDKVINSPSYYTFRDIVPNGVDSGNNVIPDVLETGKTYTISSTDDLRHLANLVNSGQDTTNITFVLTSNLDFNGEEFIPIGTDTNHFKGTFNGNGYKISNINLNTNSSYSGFFGRLDNATVSNIRLENCSFKSTNNYIGALAGGTLNNTLISNCTIKNCTVEGGNFCGGLVGDLVCANAGNCYVESTTVKGTHYVGIMLGSLRSGISDQTRYITNCNVSGGAAYSDQTEKGTFVGNSSPTTPADNQHCQISNCATSGKTYNYMGINEGSNFIGRDQGDSSIKVQLVNNTANATTVPNTTSYGSTYSPPSAIAISTLGSNESYSKNTIPSIKSDYTGGYYSNILSALTKAGAYDHHTASPSDIPQKVKNFLAAFSDNNADNSKLYYLNNEIVSYLQGSSNTTAFSTALVNDITNGTTTATRTYQNTGTVNETIRQTTDTSWVPTYHAGTSGSLTIPNIQTIKDSIIQTFKKAGYTTSESQIQNFISKYSTSDNVDKSYLAYINDIVNEYANSGSTARLANLKSVIENGDKMEISPSGLSPDEYTFNMTSTPETVHVQYGTKMVEDTSNIIGEYWDTTDPDIANAMSMWILAKRGGIEIIPNGLERSNEYLTNMLNEGFAVLTTFEPSNMAKMAEMDSSEVLALSDEEFNKLLGIENTSVATKTTIQEVSDEKDLKKAEAKYEADMKAIDRKDRKYDSELAACDTERNAIKQEMDTLKTVIKDNVDMSFKLFG